MNSRVQKNIAKCGSKETQNFSLAIVERGNFLHRVHIENFTAARCELAVGVCMNGRACDFVCLPCMVHGNKEKISHNSLDIRPPASVAEQREAYTSNQRGLRAEKFGNRFWKRNMHEMYEYHTSNARTSHICDSLFIMLTMFYFLYNFAGDWLEFNGVFRKETGARVETKSNK